MTKARGTKTLLLALLTLAALSAAPLFAAGAVQQTLQAEPLALVNAPADDCGGAAPFAARAKTILAAVPRPDAEGPACKLLEEPRQEAAAATTKSCIVGVTCTKHCACTCSQIKDCNVNSDCSNGRCFAGISCC